MANRILDMRVKLKFWVAGVALAISGLLLAKLIAPLYTCQVTLELLVFIAGVILAMAGLGVILAGLRKS